MSELITPEELLTWTDAADWVDNCGRIEETIKALTAERDAERAKDSYVINNLVADRDALKAELEEVKDSRAKLAGANVDMQAEISRLKGELEGFTSNSWVSAGEYGAVSKELTLWKSVAMGAKEALEKIARCSGDSEDECGSWSTATEALAAYPEEGK